MPPVKRLHAQTLTVVSSISGVLRNAQGCLIVELLHSVPNVVSFSVSIVIASRPIVPHISVRPAHLLGIFCL